MYDSRKKLAECPLQSLVKPSKVTTLTASVAALLGTAFAPLASAITAPELLSESSGETADVAAFQPLMGAQRRLRGPRSPTAQCVVSEWTLDPQDMALWQKTEPRAAQLLGPLQTLQRCLQEFSANQPSTSKAHAEPGTPSGSVAENLSALQRPALARPLAGGSSDSTVETAEQGPGANSLKATLGTVKDQANLMHLFNVMALLLMRLLRSNKIQDQPLHQRLYDHFALLQELHPSFAMPRLPPSFDASGLSVPIPLEKHKPTAKGALSMLQAGMGSVQLLLSENQQRIKQYAAQAPQDLPSVLHSFHTSVKAYQRDISGYDLYIASSERVAQVLALIDQWTKLSKKSGTAAFKWKRLLLYLLPFVSGGRSPGRQDGDATHWDCTLRPSRAEERPGSTLMGPSMCRGQCGDGFASVASVMNKLRGFQRARPVTQRMICQSLAHSGFYPLLRKRLVSPMDCLPPLAPPDAALESIAATVLQPVRTAAGRLYELSKRCSPSEKRAILQELQDAGEYANFCSSASKLPVETPVAKPDDAATGSGGGGASTTAEVYEQINALHRATIGVCRSLSAVNSYSEMFFCQDPVSSAKLRDLARCYGAIRSEARRVGAGLLQFVAEHKSTPPSAPRPPPSAPGPPPPPVPPRAQRLPQDQPGPSQNGDSGSQQPQEPQPSGSSEKPAHQPQTCSLSGALPRLPPRGRRLCSPFRALKRKLDRRDDASKALSNDPDLSSLLGSGRPNNTLSLFKRARVRSSKVKRINNAGAGRVPPLMKRCRTFFTLNKNRGPATPASKSFGATTKMV